MYDFLLILYQYFCLKHFELARRQRYITNKCIICDVAHQNQVLQGNWTTSYYYIHIEDIHSCKMIPH